jgi:serine/threonine protein kinase
MAFLAIASKNGFMTHDEAAQCLAEFQNQPGEERRPIEDIVADKGILTAQQIQKIAAATQRIIASHAAPKPPAPQAPPPAPPNRPPSRPAPQGGPPPARPAGSSSDPIPGVKIMGKLGVGGTATVFLADDTRHGRKAALKIIHPSLAKDEKAVRRFEREASLLISFDHPNIVRGFEKGKMGPLSWFLMELLEGESAQEALDREKAFKEAKSLEYILETAKGIDYMQSRGIIHRDIKPGNIFLLKDGRVKVLDLGFAQDMQGGDAAGEEETTSGTVQYMSPEQARGQRDLDVRADIYSLGATLYHMVMGELPFSGGDSLEVMAKQVMEALNSGGMKNRRISRHMHYFIERMMSKEKDLRYANPRELVDDITEQIEGFRSLEYRPDEGSETDSRVMKLASGGPLAGNAPGQRPTSRRFRPPSGKVPRINDITKRFKKNR